MKIAITGSTGLIGKALTRALIERGDDVIRFSRSPNPIGAAYWDPEQGVIDASALEGVEACIHLAGESVGEGRWTSEKKRRILESRVKGTTLISQTLAAMKERPRVLASASAIGFYGDRSGAPMREDSSAGEGFLADVCVAWEKATQAAQEAGIRVAHLRTGLVLDPNEGALAKMLPPFRFGVGGKLGLGKQYMSWISLEDEVRAILHVIDHDEVSGPVNLAAPNPVTNAEFTKVLARILKRPALFPVPTIVIRLLYGEFAKEGILKSIRVLPRRLLDTGFGFEHNQLEEALRAVLERPAEGS